MRAALFAIFVALIAAPNSVVESRQLNQGDAASALREAMALLKAGKLNEAEPLVRRALALAPQNADAHNLLGAILDQRGELEEAEQQYRGALVLNPNSISALANLGVLLARTNRSDQAINAFESVLQRAPDHPQATLNTRRAPTMAKPFRF